MNQGKGKSRDVVKEESHPWSSLRHPKPFFTMKNLIPKGEHLHSLSPTYSNQEPIDPSPTPNKG